MSLNWKPADEPCGELDLRDDPTWLAYRRSQARKTRIARILAWIVAPAILWALILMLPWRQMAEGLYVFTMGGGGLLIAAGLAWWAWRIAKKLIS